MDTGITAMQTGSRTRAHTETHVDGEVCFYNIGPHERRLRMTYGLINFAIGAAIGTALIVLEVPSLWRLPLAIVFIAAGTGIFQALEKT